MEPSTSNTSRNTEQWTGKTQIDRGISEMKNLSGRDIREMAGDVTHKVRDMSGDLIRDSIGFVKRYPMSSALGLAAIGFLAGAFSARMKR